MQPCETRQCKTKAVQNHAIMFISSMSLQEGSDTSGLYKMMFPNTATFLHSNIIKCSKRLGQFDYAF